MPIPCLPSVPSLLPLLPQWPLLPPPQKARQGLCPLPSGLGLRLWPGLHLWKHPREAFPGPAEHAPRAGRGENGWLMIFSMSLLRLYSEACHGFRSSHLAGPPTLFPAWARTEAVHMPKAPTICEWSSLEGSKLAHNFDITINGILPKRPYGSSWRWNMVTHIISTSDQSS